MKITDFELERFFAKWEFNAPFLLCCSDCESFTVDEVLHLSSDYETAKQGLLNQWLGYSESTGHPQLKKEISKIYKSASPDDVLVIINIFVLHLLTFQVCAGAEEAIFLFFNVLLSKGDHIIVQYPCYQSLFEIANSIGCEVTSGNLLINNNGNWILNF
jgi:DNA-binding transcriptional MocR family regulator